MAVNHTLRFAVSDHIDGREVSPSSVPLRLLREFAKDVESFIRGTDHVLSGRMLVSVEPGSLALESRQAVPLEAPIWSDMAQLSRGELDGVDPRRIEIAEKWRSSTLKHPRRSFQFGGGNVTVLINNNTIFVRRRESDWVRAERYLSGVVVDWGGLSSPNIHFRLEDGSALKIDATHEQIRDEERNVVYHQVVVRVDLEENRETGQRRNARFLGFVHYQPRIDEDEYERATRAGRAAWREVEDSVAWTRKIRGGDE
jgi:hypothetical protein